MTSTTSPVTRAVRVAEGSSLSDRAPSYSGVLPENA